MTTATLEIYNALIDAGVQQEKAEAAAKAVISRQEAKEMLASKEDLGRLETQIYKALLIHSGTTVTAIGVLMAIFTFLI